jgi:hypothetical protein
MEPHIRERYKSIYDTWLNCKSVAETARIFGVSTTRVRMILIEYPKRLAVEKERFSPHDPLLLALNEGKITQRLFNAVVRYGYGTSFSPEELQIKLRKNTLDPFQICDFGPKGLRLLREIFLNQAEMDALPVFRSQSNGEWALSRKDVK